MYYVSFHDNDNLDLFLYNLKVLYSNIGIIIKRMNELECKGSSLSLNGFMCPE